MMMATETRKTASPPRLAIENFPDHPKDRQSGFVWTRKVDGERVMFGCSTKEDCEKMLPHYEERARVADARGLDVM